MSLARCISMGFAVYQPAKRTCYKAVYGLETDLVTPVSFISQLSQISLILKPVARFQTTIKLYLDGLHNTDQTEASVGCAQPENLSV
ncbi:hypothetical protein X797_002092 [Metarhizium robertsii]|uniref:Uncharacterized protein n=1 Tax=Metarhizium robertsii TaxID=568076 RepID=A0A0A1V2M5_9HYPO|nr:hypothetical protein X797_002092 [Metarhizium robertsii]